MPRPTFSSALLAVIGVLAATGVQAAEHSASILSGGDDINPIVVNPSKPIVLIVVQLALIIALSRILHFFFSYARQPRVVSEILAGILLGPTAFGQIPGFTSSIFPQASITYLTLLSEVGLVLFLAVVGMESDMGLLKRNLKPALAVSIAGLALPFAIGCGVAYGLYRQFGAEDVKFTTFMTFIGTSSSITALPVLARILGEIGLMQDRVGLVALAAGVVNDCIGWALLALSIALANAGKGVVVVYILLTLVGWMLFLLYACRPALQWFARYTGSYGPHGPTQNFVCATLLLVFVSAFFCECIGISSIFGGFLVGLIIPAHFCHSLTAKIEDLVACILVPLYFATSGLSTNLTLLNSGIIWAWTVCVIVCAFIGKFAGCALAARFTGFNWRESGATGSLMAAKGLIELIVLNQGLTAGIISETVFSIFVLEALLLTIGSTPLALAFYPARVRNTAKHTSPSSTSSGSLGDQKRPIGGDGTSPTADAGAGAALPFKPRTRFTVVLDQLESLGAAMVFTHLFAGSASSPPASATPTTASAPMSKNGTDATLAPAGAVEREAGDVGLTTASEEGMATAGEGTSGSNTVQEAPLLAPASAIKPATSGGGGAGGLVSLIPLRLVELTDRTSSSLLAAASPAQLLHSDALAALFRTFASLFPSSLSSPSSSSSAAPAVQVDMHRAAFEVEQQERWAEVVARKAAEEGSEGVVVGWKIGGGGGMAIGLGGAGVVDVAGDGKHVGPGEGSILPNPFSHLFPASQPASYAADPSSSSRPHLPRAPSSSSVSPHAAAAEITHGTAPRFAAFLRALFLEASCDVSVLIDRSGASSFPPHDHAPAVGGGTTLFVPFFGGADDRAALELAAQVVLRSNGGVRARVCVIERAAEETDEDRAALGAGTGGAEARLSEEESTPGEEGEEKLGRLHHLNLDGQHGLTTGSQTHYPTAAGGRTLATAAGGGGGLASQTADSVLVAQIEALSLPSPSAESGGGSALLPPGALVIERVQTAHPLRTMLRRLSSLPNSGSEGGQGKTLTLLGRSRRDAPSHLVESRALLLAAQKAGRLQGSVVQSEQVRRAVGEAASQVLLGLGGEGAGEGEGGGGWVWVVQSRWTAGRRGVRRRVGEEA